MSEPVLLVVDEDAEALHDVEATLRDRYSSSYRVECRASAADARALLASLAASGDDVALVLTGQFADEATTTDLLDDTRRLHPHAKRVLVIGWGEWGIPATGETIFRAIAEARIDHYVIRPSPPPDEMFHSAVSGMLLEWADAQRVSPNTIYIVGEEWSGRAFELRDLLGKCAMPHAFVLTDSSDGRELSARAGAQCTYPMVVLPDGTVLQNPTNTEILVATGSPAAPGRNDFDVVIVGGGPAGLSAAVYGASEGFSTLVVDQGGIGGQATSSSSIRNYLGFSRGISGRRLAQQAYEQAWVFGAEFAFLQRVLSLERDADGLVLTLADSGPVRARAVLLATGATYRGLGIAELDALNGAGVVYGGTASEAPATVGQHVFVVGGANSAGQAALHLARYAAHVSLVVRADSLDEGMSHYLVQQIAATPAVEVRLATEVVGGGGDGKLEFLVLRKRGTDREEIVGADGLFLMIGAEPHTEWLPPEVARTAGGFVLTGAAVADHPSWPLDRAPLALESSLPGVFAAGDVRDGSVKRVASAVGEGSVAIQLLHHWFELEHLTPRGRVERASV